MKLAVACLATALTLPACALADEGAGWVRWKTDSASAQTRTLADLRFGMATQIASNGRRTPILTISDGVRPPLRIEGERGMSSATYASFGVFQLDRRRAGPVVLFSSYSGGAHCCNMYRAAYAEGGGWTVRKLGRWHTSATPQVRDVDGDGRLELVGRDQRFAYAFTSYAESVPPAQVYELVDGELVDVSGDPRYRRVFLRELKDLRSHCERDRARGYCASYAATAARLGRIDEASDVLDRAFPNNGEADSAPLLHPGPGGSLRKPFPTFREAVTWYLGELGYLPTPSAGAAP